MDLTLTLALIVAAAFFAAGMVKGVSGIGLPAVSIGLTTLFLDPRDAVALLILPMMASNFWQAARLGGLVEAARRYWLFGLVMIAAILVATTFAARASVSVLYLVTGFAFVLFSVVNLTVTPPPLPDRWDRPAQVAGGLGAGLLGGLTAMWGPPIAIYLAARHVSRDEFVRATGMLFTVGGIPLAFGYARAGLFTGPEAALSAVMVVPVLAGFTIGEALRRRIPSDRFRRLILWIFLILGANLIRRGILAGG